MSTNRPKSIDALMRYLRDQKHIHIAGSYQKRKLMNIGYYHAYKGYRYINAPSNQVLYRSFDELVAVYDFDSQVKSSLYPAVMFIETALKNYVLDAIVTRAHTDSFNDVYISLLDNYKSFSLVGRTFRNPEQRRKAEEKYSKEIKRRLELRNRIYRSQTEAYSKKNRIADHFLSNNRSMPIWATFELLTLGEFGNFVACLNEACRLDISHKLGIRPVDDTSGYLPQRLIFAIRDLRNAIAHNDVVFDARFKTSNIDNQVSNAIKNVSAIGPLSFDTITDWIVLIIYVLKLLKVSKTEMKRLIISFEDSVERLRSSVSTSIFNQIIHTDHQAKMNALKTFVTR